MSVSKSIVGCVAGILAERGAARPRGAGVDVRPRGRAAPGTADAHRAPPARHAHRRGRSARPTREPDAEVRVMERSMGWRPRSRTATRSACTRTWRPSARHGRTAAPSPTGPPTPTCSAGSASGRPGTRMADLVSSLLWHADRRRARRRDHLRLGRLGASTTAASPRPRATWRGSASCCSTTVRSTAARWSRRPGWPTRGTRRADVRAGVRRTDNEEVLPGRLVPQPVLVRAGPRRRRAGLPGHPRPDGLRQPRHPDRSA